MRRGLLALTLVAFAAVVAIYFTARSEVQRADAAVGSPRDSTSAKEPLAKVELPAMQSATRESERVEAQVPLDPIPAQSPSKADDLAELRGRFLLPGGIPAAGVKLELSGFAGNDELVRKFGKPDHWDKVPGLTDAEGRFALRFDPPLAFQFFLQADLVGYAQVRWRWSSLPPHAVTDVGEIVLTTTGSIHGRVVDAAGKIVPGDWRAYADSAYKPAGEGGDATRVSAAVDAKTAEFLLEGLPPGPTKLKVYSGIANWTDGPSVTVRSGETLEADIVYAGPDNSRRIVVIPTCRPLYIFDNPAAGSIVLSGPGVEREARMIAHSSQSWAFDELEPGTYTVEVRDPRYLPWSQSGVTPGTEVRARLKGSAAVTLSVLGDGGAPVDDYILRVDYHTSRTTPHVFDLRAAKAPMPASGVYDGLIPDDLTLHIEASGYTNCDVIVAALLPNERRAVTAQLDHGSSLRGVVLDATTRAPVSGVDVALGAYIEDAEDSPARFNKFQSLLDARHNSRTTKSDASGHFSFDSVPHAAYELRARLGPLVHIELAPVVLDGGERSVELVLPASGFLVGRLIGPDGARFDGLSLSAQRSTPQVDKFAAFLESSSIEGGSRASVESDGNFRLGPLPAGEIVVRLDYPEVEMATGFNSSMGTPGPQRVLGTVVIEPGGDTRHDFDLRESFPGSLSVSIHVDGQLGASLVVIAVLDPEKAMSQGNMSSATSDASGVARLAPLPPGSWTISVRPIDSIWTWTAPVPVEISAGQQRELSADIALVEDEITLVRDQDRKPFVTRGFVIKTSGGLIISVKSDGAGRVKLRLPPGHYQIADAGESEFGWAGDSEFTALEWGTTGPLEKVLRVRQADKRD